MTESFDWFLWAMLNIELSANKWKWRSLSQFRKYANKDNNICSSAQFCSATTYDDDDEDLCFFPKNIVIMNDLVLL